MSLRLPLTILACLPLMACPADPDGGPIDGTNDGQVFVDGDAAIGTDVPLDGEISVQPDGDAIIGPDGDAIIDPDSDAIIDPDSDILTDGDATVSDGTDTPTPDAEIVEDTGPEIPEPDIDAPFSNCSEPGGDRNIYDLQDPKCPDHFTPEPTGSNGVAVDLKNVIVTAVFSDTIFIQEEASGPYSGIAVFTHGLPTDDLTKGTIVDVKGSYSEFFDTSQIYLNSYSVIGITAPPLPYVPEHPSYFNSESPVAEAFEGVLVRIDNVKVQNTKPDCPHDFGEFVVEHGVRIDDMGHTWDAHVWDTFSSIEGPLHYAFGNYKIEPHDDTMLNPVVGSGTTTKCVKGDCIEPASKLGTKELVVSEMMPDPFGNDGGQEWIELYNPGSSAVDVNGWKIRNCSTLSYTLAGSDLIVPAGGFLVLGAQKDSTLNGGVPVDLGYGDAFYLPNTVGAVLLYTPAGVLVDQARYSAFEPWEAFKLGRSIERVQPSNDGTLPESWEAGKGKFGPTDNQGTPGDDNTGW